MTDHAEFLSTVCKCWGEQFTGVKMYRVWCKLKLLREHFKKLGTIYLRTGEKIESARAQLEIHQAKLQLDPLNAQLFADMSLPERRLINGCLLRTF